MNRLSLALLCLLLTGLAACTGFPFSRDPQSQQQQDSNDSAAASPRSIYQQAVSDNDFAAATAALNQLAMLQGEESVDDERQQLRRLMDTYRAHKLAEIDQHVDNGHWGRALELLQMALAKLPGDLALKARRREITVARNAQLNELQLRLTLLEAGYLVTKLQLLEEISAAQSGLAQFDWQLDQTRQSGHKLAADLLVCAENALGQGDIAQAESCLQYVGPLAAVDQTKQIAAATRIVNAVRARSQRIAAAEQARQERDLALEKAALKEEYRDAVSARWWLSAQEKLRELEQRYPDDADLPGWRTQLQGDIDNYVAASLRQGQHSYSRGRISRALRIWRQALSLDPDHPELTMHVLRAEKFLDKLNELESGER